MPNGAELYRLMKQAQLWEQRLLRMIDEGQVSGFYHSGRGQEAIPAGAVSTLGTDDYLLYAHRGLGYLTAKGVPMEKLFGDFLGREIGTTGGLGAGIVHIAWPALGVLGQSGTLGGNFPIAVGAGLSAKYRGTDQVVLSFFGDGTSSRGTFHESANAAALWKLPVVWICENNGYAATVPSSSTNAVTDISRLAYGYGMPGVIVDGQDVEAVQAATQEAVDRARNGEGPTLIEAKTYRYRGHYEGDPQNYRSKEEVALWRERDPISSFEQTLIARNELTETELLQIQKELQVEVDDCAEAALASAEPPVDRIFRGVYSHEKD